MLLIKKIKPEIKSCTSFLPPILNIGILYLIVYLMSWNITEHRLMSISNRWFVRLWLDCQTMYPDALSASPLLILNTYLVGGEPDKLLSVDLVKRNVSLSTFYTICLHVSEDVRFYWAKKSGSVISMNLLVMQPINFFMTIE